MKLEAEFVIEESLPEGAAVIKTTLKPHIFKDGVLVQEVLVELLQSSNVSKNNTIAVILLLKDSENKMQQLAIWIYDNHPSEEEIMRKAIAMSEQER